MTVLGLLKVIHSTFLFPAGSKLTKFLGVIASSIKNCSRLVSQKEGACHTRALCKVYMVKSSTFLPQCRQDLLSERCRWYSPVSSMH